jgi:hypothetical protein
MFHAQGPGIDNKQTRRGVGARGGGRDYDLILLEECLSLQSDDNSGCLWSGRRALEVVGPGSSTSRDCGPVNGERGDDQWRRCGPEPRRGECGVTLRTGGGKGKAMTCRGRRCTAEGNREQAGQDRDGAPRRCVRWGRSLATRSGPQPDGIDGDNIAMAQRRERPGQS